MGENRKDCNDYPERKRRRYRKVKLADRVPQQDQRPCLRPSRTSHFDVISQWPIFKTLLTTFQLFGDDVPSLRRTKDRSKSVRFNAVNEWRSYSVSLAPKDMFRDISNEGVKPEFAPGKSVVPKSAGRCFSEERQRRQRQRDSDTAPTYTFQSLIGAPHDPNADNCMILGTPGAHLLLQKFSKKREHIRKRSEEEEENPEKSSRPNVRTNFDSTESR